VVCGHGREAATADGRHAGPLGLDAPARLGVVSRRHGLLLACSDLKRERTLAGLRQKLGRLEPVVDLVLEAKPVEATGGEDHRVETTLSSFPETRVDVAAQRLDPELGLER
jgi:hypothetical protein